MKKKTLVTIILGVIAGFVIGKIIYDLFNYDPWDEMYEDDYEEEFEDDDLFDDEEE